MMNGFFSQTFQASSLDEAVEKYKQAADLYGDLNMIVENKTLKPYEIESYVQKRSKTIKKPSLFLLDANNTIGYKMYYLKIEKRDLSTINPKIKMQIAPLLELVKEKGWGAKNATAGLFQIKGESLEFMPGYSGDIATIKDYVNRRVGCDIFIQLYGLKQIFYIFSTSAKSCYVVYWDEKFQGATTKKESTTLRIKHIKNYTFYGYK